MCHVSVIEFFIDAIDCGEFDGRRVLEVGSKYVNGSVRPLIERFCKPREYVGIDLEPGKYVDLVLPAERLLDYFGPESFDVVISTELLEHVKDWRLVINNMKGVLRRGGYIYVTTRSRGFPYHAYPSDYWRYEINDMRVIFRDFEILELRRDHEAPGVFLKARKPMNYRPVSLEDVSLYSIILGRRTRDIVDLNDAPTMRRVIIKLMTGTRIQWLMPCALNSIVIGRVVRRYLT